MIEPAACWYVNLLTCARTPALRRTADLEQLRAFSLVPPATNNIIPKLLARWYALLCVFSLQYTRPLSLS